MNSTIGFIKSLWKMPIAVRLWLMVLGMSNMMAPLFFLDQFEARFMLGATILGFFIGVILFKAYGLTRLHGLMHAPWLVAVYLLLKKLMDTGFAGSYSIWVCIALTVTSISLLIDIADVIRYTRGDRKQAL